MPTGQDLKQIAKKIIEREGPPQVFELGLDEFKEVYRFVLESNEVPVVDIVLNGDTASAQFTNMCNHRIVIRQNVSSGIFHNIFGRTSLEKSDFDFDFERMLKPRFHGQLRHLSLFEFIREEIECNWPPLLLVGLVCGVLFLQFGNREVYLSLNDALVSSATLFVTVFLLFSVSQNAAIVRDLKAFENGTMHRWFAIDRYIALVAIVSLGIAIVARTLLKASGPISFSLGNNLVIWSDLGAFGGILTALVIILLADCFLAITEYYFQQIRMVVFRDLTQQVLDRAIEPEQKDQK